MTKDVVVVEKDISILEAAKIMEQKNISSVVVVEKGKPIGILTERDIVRKAMIRKIDVTSSVVNAMSSPLLTVEKNEDVTKAAEIMMSKKIRRLPVVDKGKMVGILTETNITGTSPKAVSEFSSTIEKIDKILKGL